MKIRMFFWIYKLYKLYVKICIIFYTKIFINLSSLVYLIYNDKNSNYCILYWLNFNLKIWFYFIIKIGGKWNLKLKKFTNKSVNSSLKNSAKMLSYLKKDHLWLLDMMSVPHNKQSCLLEEKQWLKRVWAGWFHQVLTEESLQDLALLGKTRLMLVLE